MSKTQRVMEESLDSIAHPDTMQSETAVQERTTFSSSQAVPTPPSQIQVRTRSIVVSILATFLIRIASNATAFMVGIYLQSKEVNAPLWTVGIVITCFYITELLLAPVMGALSDKRGRKLFMILGPAIGIVAVQIHPLTTMVVIIMAGRLVEGLAAATAIPSTLGYLSDVTEGNPVRRGRIMTFFEVATVVGIALGQAAGGPLWDTFGPNGFRFLSLIYIVVMVITYFLMEDSSQVGTRSQSEHSSFSQYWTLLTNKYVISFIPAWIALNAIAGSWLDFVPSLLKSQPEAVLKYPGQLLVAGYKGSQASMILLIYGIAFAVGMGLWSLVFGRLRKTTIMLIALGGLTVATVCLFIINGLDTKDWRGTAEAALPTNAQDLHLVTMPLPLVITIVIILLIGIMLESGFTPAALAHLADISSLFPEKRGVLMGLYSVLLGVGQLAGGWLGGPFVQIWGFNGIVYLTVILLAISFYTVILVRKHGGDQIGSGGGKHQA